MTQRVCYAIAGLLLMAGASMAQSQDGDTFNTDASGLALQGYDPVAYFQADAAVPGDPGLTAQYEGVRFQFATEANRSLFVSSPEKYLPAYGGWCAWAASRGSLADIDPTKYVIHEGRLYVNYNGILNWRFRQNLDTNIEQADQNWPTLSEEARKQ